MRRLPVGMLVAASATVWCAQVSAQHMPTHRAPVVVPPPGTQTTPSPSPRAPGGGGPWGTATVDPRCATSVVCGPAQTAAPGGGQGPGIGPDGTITSSKPEVRTTNAVARGLQRQRNQLQRDLREAEEHLAAMDADPNFSQRSENKRDDLQNELFRLLNGTHFEHRILEDLKSSVLKTEQDLAFFREERSRTDNPTTRQQLDTAIQNVERALFAQRDEVRAQQRRIEQRRAELEARRNSVRAENESKWQEAHNVLTNRIATLRARLGLPANNAGALVNMLSQ